jgi:hypothetical protein
MYEGHHIQINLKATADERLLHRTRRFTEAEMTAVPDLRNYNWALYVYTGNRLDVEQNDREIRVTIEDGEYICDPATWETTNGYVFTGIVRTFVHSVGLNQEPIRE